MFDYVLPRTMFGQWCTWAGTALSICVVTAAIGAFSGPSEAVGNGSYFDAWWIAIPLLLAGIFSIIAFIFGTVSIIFFKERSLLVAFASFVGLIAVGLWIGEVF